MAKKIITVPVEFREEPIPVTKSGLLIWGEITAKFDTVLASIFGKLDEDLSDEQFMAEIPRLVSENIPKVIDMLEVSTPLTREEIENFIDPAEALELVIAVIEVNNLLKVNDQIKKLKTMFK